MNIDEIGMRKFRSSFDKVRRELEESIIDMYSHLHLFQRAYATIIEKKIQIQEKLIEFNMI